MPETNEFEYDPEIDRQCDLQCAAYLLNAKYGDGSGVMTVVQDGVLLTNSDNTWVHYDPDLMSVMETSEGFKREITPELLESWRLADRADESATARMVG